MITANHLLTVNGFFDSYAHALENYDAKGMAYHYTFPCTILDDEYGAVFTDVTRLEGLFGKGIGFYRQFGIAHVRPEVWSKRQWSDRLIKVKLNWKYYNGENGFLYGCAYHYVLRLDKSGAWKIQVAVSVNEKQQMEAWMKQIKN